MEKHRWVVLSVLSALVLLSIAGSAWRYLYNENYFFSLEASCNSDKERCFTRDCTNPDSCPSNGLAEYKIVKVKATDFKKCTDSSCTTECASNLISCDVKYCDASQETDGVTCSSVAENNPPQ